MAKASGGTRASRGGGGGGAAQPKPETALPSEISSASEGIRSQLADGYKRVQGMTNEQKMHLSPTSDPHAYTAAGRTSPEKKEIMSFLSSKASSKEETPMNPSNTGASGTYKVGNQFIRVNGLQVTTGLKTSKGKSSYLGIPGSKRWYGGGTSLTETAKTQKFSVYDTDKVAALKKSIK